MEARMDLCMKSCGVNSGKQCINHSIEHSIMHSISSSRFRNYPDAGMPSGRQQRLRSFAQTRAEGERGWIRAPVAVSDHRRHMRVGA